MNVNRLYRLPAGETGVVSGSSEHRYPGPSDRSGIICNHLPTVALLARAAAAVTGVLVREAHLPEVSPGVVLGDSAQVMADMGDQT